MADNGDLAWGLERARAADPRGFHALFRILGPSVVGYLRARKVDDPDGVANDVFVRAFRKIDTFDGEAEQFRSWVFTIAHNAGTEDPEERMEAARICRACALESPLEIPGIGHAPFLSA